MSDQPKPSTGEWTVERLREYLGGYSSYDLRLRAMSKLINAALAAEREKYAALTGSSDEVIEIDEEGKITQPKPATGEHKPWCQAITSERGVGPFPCDCKPATGEWTGDYVANEFKINAWDICDKIAEAHNAALAAERETTDPAMSETVEWTPQTVNDLVRHDGYKGVADAHNRLELELAKAQAAIARHNFQMDVDRDINCTEIKTDTTALDAAIAEFIKPLVDALAEISKLPGPRTPAKRIAYAALSQESNAALRNNIPVTKGKWTANMIGMYYVNGQLETRQLVDAINAALAAEREASLEHWQKWQDESKSHRNDIDYQNREIEELEKQLAAERDNADKAAARAELAQIQLAAEGSRHDKRLERELAAAQAALVECGARISDLEIALAKVGK